MAKVSYQNLNELDDGAHRVASVAVGSAISRVNPAPIGINDYRAIFIRAAGGGTLLPGKRRMGLCLLSANLLGIGTCHQGREQECALIHRWNNRRNE